MKIAKNICKAIALLFSVAVLALFFADFVVIKTTVGDVALTGAELAFRSKQTVGGAEVEVARSSYYLFTFLFVAASALFAGLAFKWKRANVASLVTGIVTAIMAIIFLAEGAWAHVDRRPLTGVQEIHFTPIFIAFFVTAIAAMLVTAAAILIIDAMEAKAARRPTILKRIVQFLREYASELRKIVWPTGKSVVRGTVIVLIMCLIAGAFVWILDFGLGRLLTLILGIDS